MSTAIEKKELEESEEEIRERQKKQDFLIGLCQDFGDKVSSFDMEGRGIWVKFSGNGVSTRITQYAEDKGFLVAGTYWDKELGVTGVSFREMEFGPDEIVGQPE